MRVSGYVLAGGKSSRMGQDKALLELGGRPLVELAVEKVKAFCADAYLLSSRAVLATFAPLVADLHTGCGPLGGMEAGLLHSAAEWSLFLPVDVPFIPLDLLRKWVAAVVVEDSARASIFVVEGQPQPALCLVHREVTPFIVRAVAAGELKVLPVLGSAATELGARRGVSADRVLVRRVLDGEEARGWFVNLNTPEDFAAAGKRWC